MIEFKATKEEHETIGKILKRFRKESPAVDGLSFVMDLDACHSNGTQLDFDKLLAFPPFDFAHDCHGIMANMDRKTGRLKNFFLPRCSKSGAEN